MTQGTCTTCQRRMAKAAMTRHVASCGRSERGPAALVMSVTDRGAPGDYWLHLELPASTPLRTLDRFLRDLWLECCGHLSMFEIDLPRRGRGGAPRRRDGARLRGRVG